MRLLCLALLTVNACASHTKLAEPVRAEISARHIGRTVELRQSMVWGELYDENEKWLLSPYPFAETFHIVDTDGAPIHPKGQRGIVPAGAAFKVQKVEFPDVGAMAARMLTTPRYNPWVYLEPAEGNPLPRDRKSFILLLPMDLDTEKAAEEEIARVLAPAGEVTQWLAERAPSIRVAIEHKDVVTGMSLKELVASQGEPQRWFNEGDKRVAWYPTREAWLSRDEVVDVKPGRIIEEKAPEPQPAPEPQAAAY